MNYLVCLLLIFLTNCSYLGYISNINDPKVDPKIEAQRQEEIDLHPFAIMQGLTTPDFADIKIVAKKDKAIAFKVFQNDLEIKTIKIDKVIAGETDYVVYQVRVTSLKPNTNYTLQVLEDNKISDQRYFETVDLNIQNPRIGVVSCMNDKFKDAQFLMWHDYLKHSPTYTFMIGDNVYANSVLGTDGIIQHFQFVKPELLWRRYIETFNLISYYKSSRLVPTLGIWDDHDYGNNNGDESYPYKKESLKIFETFYGFKDVPSKNKNQPIVEKIGGAGYVFRAFNQNFIFIDGRSFRSIPAMKGKEGETHLGIDQTAKILKTLDSTTPSWLIKGDQFFGAYHPFESYEASHPHDFKNFLNDLKNKKSKIFFVSGDRHLNELMKIEAEQIGYETFELTSSAIHATLYPNAWKKHPNPRKIQGASGIYNYSIVELKNLTPWSLSVESYGPQMKPLFKEDLIIQ